MKRFSLSLMASIVPAAVLIFSQISASRVSADENVPPRKVVTINQDMFVRSEKYGPVRIEHLRFESAEGVRTNFHQLPSKAKKCVLRLESQICPHVEYSTIPPVYVIRFLASKPKPASTISLGDFADDKNRETDPPWLGDLSIGENLLSCVVTNVSFLDLCLVVADAFSCEFGVTSNGEPLFRNKTPEAKAKHPIYAIKSK